MNGKKIELGHRKIGYEAYSVALQINFNYVIILTLIKYLFRKAALIICRFGFSDSNSPTNGVLSLNFLYNGCSYDGRRFNRSRDATINLGQFSTPDRMGADSFTQPARPGGRRQ